MSKTARIEITKISDGWEATTPFGSTWGTATFHGPDHLKKSAINHFNINNKGEYDDYAILVQCDTGWF